MRIAMVSEHASPLAALGGVDAGGQNVHVAELAAALARQGHQVDVYTRLDDPALPERVRLADGFDVVHVPAGPPGPEPKDALAVHMPAFGRWLARRWRQQVPDERPDLVHAHFWMSGVAATLARAELGLPQVQTFHALGVVKRRHQGAADTSPAGRLPAESRLARSVDAVIATCTDEVRELLELGAPAAALHVVPCGVDVDAFRPADPRPVGDGRFRLLAAGRMVPRKGLTTAVAALAGLPDTELLVAGGPPADQVGEDPHARELLTLAADTGVADRLHLLGRVDHAMLPGLYRTSDVVVAVPWYEPFGIVPLEAMACGVPVVASAVGGMLDTVQDRVTGLLVPPRDPRALGEAVRVLRQDDALRRSMSAAAVRHARSHYTWDGVAAATAAVYRSVLAEAGAVVPAREEMTLVPRQPDGVRR